MEYIVASTGRCGSTLLADLIAGASSRKKRFVTKLDGYNGLIKKALLYLRKKPDFNYRAVFIYGDFGDSIASLYRGYGPKWVRKHLEHLKVNPVRRFGRGLNPSQTVLYFLSPHLQTKPSF